MQKLLTIVVPAYNASPYISRCLASIYAIPLQEDTFEVIVVDDCSTDDTYNILQKYARGHSNLRIFRQLKNKRQGAARNVGIDAAQGEYITFCDADDYMLPEGVMNALLAVEKSYADICYFDFEYEKPNGEWQLFEMPQETRNKILSASEYLNNYYTCYYNAPWRTLYRTEFLRQTGIWFAEGVRWEDCDWTVKVYAKAKEIQFVDGVGYRYAWNEAATSKQVDAQAMIEQLKAGVRLTIFADEVRPTLPGLFKVLLDEAKYRYVIQNIRLRNLTKYRISNICTIYNEMSVADWKAIDTLGLTKWERIVVRHHELTLLILCFAYPIAAIGRKVMEIKRKIE